MRLDEKIYSNNGNQGGFVIDSVKLKWSEQNYQRTNPLRSCIFMITSAENKCFM